MNQSRRGFLKKLLIGAGGVCAALGSRFATDGAASSLIAGVAQAAEPDDLVWVEGRSPYDNTVAALKGLGGIQRFVKKGQRVTILPNIGWARTMEQGANTHPQVVRALIDQCHEAGAKSIDIFCNPCNDMRVCLELSGIGEVIEDSPAQFEFISKQGWRKRQAVKGCTLLKEADVYRLFDEAEVVINAPVAKHHGGAQLTMCCKNLMGAVRDRRTIHQKLHDGIADLTMMLPHQLCVLDASRILLRNGPTGGNIKDTKRMDTVIAGIDPVHVDVLGTTLFKQKPSDIGYLKQLADRGYGPIDPQKLKVARITA